MNSPNIHTPFKYFKNTSVNVHMNKHSCILFAWAQVMPIESFRIRCFHIIPCPTITPPTITCTNITNTGTNISTCTHTQSCYIPQVTKAQINTAQYICIFSFVNLSGTSHNLFQTIYKYNRHLTVHPKIL